MTEPWRSSCTTWPTPSSAWPAPGPRSRDLRARRRHPARRDGRREPRRRRPARPAAQRRRPAARCGGSCPACPGSGSPPPCARRPRRVAGRTVDLAAELAKVGLGRSELEPHEKDRRFADEALGQEPAPQAHPAGLPRARRDAARPGRRTPSSAGATSSGWASSSTTSSRRPPRATTRSLNPKVLKRVIDTGGGNLVDGGRRFVRDFATAPRVPSMVEPDAFEVGTRHRGDPRGRGAAHRRLRADPVHPADRPRSARCRC